jgi:hypothetical protein
MTINLESSNDKSIYASQLKYYYKNKDKINQGLRNGKIKCECGSSIPKYHEKRHHGTKKHRSYLEARELFIFTTNL